MPLLCMDRLGRKKMTAGCFILSGAVLLSTMAVVNDKGKHVMYFPFENVRVMFTWASCQIHRIAGCACVGNAGNVFPATDFKGKPPVWRSRHASRHVRDARAVMHVRSLTSEGGENVSGIPSACATRNLTYLARAPWTDSVCFHSPRHVCHILICINVIYIYIYICVCVVENYDPLIS